MYVSRFYVESSLPCEGLIGTMLLSRFLHTIRCINGTVELTRGISPILVNNKVSTDDRNQEKEAAIQAYDPLPPTQTSIRIFKPLKTPPMSQAYVRVAIGVDGTIHIRPKNSLFTRTGIRLDNETHEVQR